MAQSKAMLNQLSRDFDRRPETVLQWSSTAMARGEVTKKGLQVPRFVIALPEHGGINIIAVEDGETEDPETGASVNLDLGASDTEPAVMGADDISSWARREALANAVVLLPAAVESEPLAIDQKIAKLLIPSIAVPYPSC